MFGTMAGGESPGPGRPENNRAQCLADDLGGFQAAERSKESSPLLFGVDTVLWPRAAKKSGKWYRGVVEAADRFMARWHRFLLPSTAVAAFLISSLLLYSVSFQFFFFCVFVFLLYFRSCLCCVVFSWPVLLFKGGPY